MEQITVLLASVSHLLPGANVNQFGLIIQSIYTISSGGVTQKNISRYGDLSYRSVSRFMGCGFVWGRLLISLLSIHFTSAGDTFLIAIDETVEDKAGKSTSKLGYFYCSKAKKAIKSVSFSVASLISVKERKSYVVDFEQLEQDKEKSAENKAKKQTAKAKKESGDTEEKKPVGRPKGSTNKIKQKSDSVGSVALETLLNRLLPLLCAIGIVPCYLVGDGAYGNMTGCLIAAECHLDLISKLHYNTALFFPPQEGTKQRKYGEPVDFTQLESYKIGEDELDGFTVTYFQIKKARMRHIDKFINVVIVRCLNLKTKKFSYVLLFSTDLELDGMTLLDYYALRFQIEFNFRDSKQYFGLSDFRSIKPIQVTNAVGLSFFMVNLSQILIAQTKAALGVDFLSIQDLKAYFRAIFYAQRLKNTPDLAVPNILDPKVAHFVANLGGVNWDNLTYSGKKAA
jgi:putative transposase